MRSHRTLFAFACILALAGAAVAQESPSAAPSSAPPAPLPPAEPVLSHVPAGAMGFFAINNLKSTGTRIDAFLVAIGLGEDVKQAMPNGVVETIRGGVGFGPNFNPDGGIAVIMLDPQKFDVDIIALMEHRPPTTQPGKENEPPAEQKIPYAIFLPGQGVAEVLGPSMPAEPAGAYFKVMMPFGEMMAAQIGGYVVLSPSAKVLDAIAKTEKTVMTELSASEQKAVTESDIAIHVNMTVSGPTISKVLEHFESMFAAMQSMSPNPAMSPAGMLGMYRDMISQMQSLTIAARLAPTGIVIEELVQAKPESELGKAMAAQQSAGTISLDRVPNLPYVFAMGALQEPNADPKYAVDMQARMLNMLMPDKLSEETKTKINTLTQQLSEQVVSTQLVIGGAPPEPTGVFGVSCVLNVKDSETVKGLIAQGADLALTIVKTLAADDPKTQQLVIKYVKDAEKAGDVSVDTIEFDHPELASQPAEDKADMAKVLGEDKIRVYVFAPDKQTVVITFGGGKPMVEAALKASKGNGNILALPESQEALAVLPKNLQSVVLINGANLWTVVEQGAKVMGSESLPKYAFTCKTPLAIGSATEAGASARVVVYIPNGMVKDVVGLIKTLTAPPPAPPAEPGTTQPAAPGKGNEQF
jgi:hypothetical protein